MRWTLARMLRVCASHGIDGSDAIEAFGLAPSYDAAAVAEWIGLS